MCTNTSIIQSAMLPYVNLFQKKGVYGQWNWGWGRRGRERRDERGREGEDNESFPKQALENLSSKAK